VEPSPGSISSRAQRCPPSALLPYTTLFRSPHRLGDAQRHLARRECRAVDVLQQERVGRLGQGGGEVHDPGHACQCLQDGALLARSEEHTSELQSRENLVCRLLLEKTKKVPP